MDSRDRRAIAHLNRDPRLEALIRSVGPPRFHEYSRVDLLHNLLEAIVAQQLSAKVARVIFDRFKEKQGEGFPDPPAILGTPETELRALGFSRAKAACVRDLCRRIVEGRLRVEVLATLPDEEVAEALGRVKGIGPWTVHMVLIFALGRPDVWPAADLGLRRSLEKLLALPALPTPREAEPMGDGWRPYRSYATWYLWQVNDLNDGIDRGSKDG